MTCKSLTLSSVFIAASLSAVHAQEFSGAVTLGYNALSIDQSDEDGNIGSLDATVDANFGNGFNLGADLSIQSLDIDDDSLTTTSIALDGHYRFANGLTAGAYVQNTSIDTFGDQSFASYGLTFGYETDLWGVEAFYGQTDTDDSPFDITDYGVLGWYAPNEQLTLGGGVIRTEVDDVDQELTLVRLAGAYDINDSWTAFAGIDNLSFDEADFTSFGIGIGYDLSQVMGRSAVASIELSRLSSDNFDVDVVEIGLTIPLGPNASKVPLNSVAGHILRPKHSALNGIFDTGIPAFF